MGDKSKIAKIIDDVIFAEENFVAFLALHGIKDGVFARIRILKGRAFRGIAPLAENYIFHFPGTSARYYLKTTVWDNVDH